jgi:site-specific recombinase XerD
VAPVVDLGERTRSRNQLVADDQRVSVPLKALVREWLLDLQVMGRSENTLIWYKQKLDGYFSAGGVKDLKDLTSHELKRHLAELQSRGLSDNTVHGVYQTIKSLANWAEREGYAVDPALLRTRGPKVAQKEMHVYSTAQLDQILDTCHSESWGRIAVQILIGTGMRVSEMADLRVEDFEDDDEAAFLKVQKGKGAKFRRVPVMQRLRRELIRYVNRIRPLTKCDRLVVLPDGRPVTLTAVNSLFWRIRRKVGFPVHAHRFRHTFATEYLRNRGEMERLRGILGHTTYFMVMRYVHLDKGDLSADFDLRSPF